MPQDWGAGYRLERQKDSTLQLALLRTVPGRKPRHMWEFPSPAFLVSISFLKLQKQQPSQPAPGALLPAIPDPSPLA